MVDQIQSVSDYTGGVAIRKQKTNFSEYTAQFLTFLVGFIPELKTSIAGMNNLIPAIEAAAQAASIVNYAGLWSGLTGALPIPASTYHQNAVWMLLESLADVAAEEPGTSLKWVLVGGGRIGVDTVSSAADVTLTSSSKQIQRLSMTLPGLFANLPDATTLKNGEFFDFFNDGIYRHGINDATGIFKASIEAKGYGKLTLLDNSAPAGVWKATDGADLIMARLKTVINAVQSDWITSCKLTATSVFAAWKDGANSKGIAQVFTFVPGTPVINESNEVEFSATAVSYLSTSRMTDTVPILAYSDADMDGRIAALTHTPGTNTLSLTYTYEFKDASTVQDKTVNTIYSNETDGKIGLTYKVSAQANLYSQVLNWTGSSITPNTAETALVVGSEPIGIRTDVLSGSIDTAELAILYGFDSGASKVHRVTWATGTISYSSSVFIGSGSGELGCIRALNADYFVTAYRYISGNQYYSTFLALYSSSLIRLRTIRLISNYQGDTAIYPNQLTALDSENLSFVVSPNKDSEATVYKIKAIGAASSADCVFRIESKTDIGRIGSAFSYQNLTGMDANGALYIHQGDNGYLNVDRIEIG